MILIQASLAVSLYNGCMHDDHQEFIGAGNTSTHHGWTGKRRGRCASVVRSCPIAVSSNGPKDASKTNRFPARLSIHGEAKRVNGIGTRRRNSTVVCLSRA